MSARSAVPNCSGKSSAQASQIANVCHSGCARHTQLQTIRFLGNIQVWRIPKVDGVLNEFTGTEVNPQFKEGVLYEETTQDGKVRLQEGHASKITTALCCKAFDCPCAAAAGFENAKSFLQS